MSALTPDGRRTAVEKGRACRPTNFFVHYEIDDDESKHALRAGAVRARHTDGYQEMQKARGFCWSKSEQ